jgi:glucose-1-phosphate thymidylyltransferase
MTTASLVQRPRKGVIVAGGSGTRLYPMTIAVNKQLLPVYDKPMIYYPLTTLMLAGIREITIVSSLAALPQFRAVLGEGGSWGLKFHYVSQTAPEGIAHALLMTADYVEGSPVALILGDNIYYRSGLPDQLKRAGARTRGATIFTYPVPNPTDFGVVALNARGEPVALEEKPVKPQSNLAVTGLYFFDANAVD